MNRQNIKGLLQSVRADGAAFSFAGFVFPKCLWTADRKTISARKRPFTTGPYYHAPTPQDKHGGLGFYLGGVGMPCTRFDYADDVVSSITHKGWFCDAYGDQTIRGIVLRLSHGRYLAGWTMGEGMASKCDRKIYSDPEDCALMADELARIAADNQRDFDENEAKD